MTDEEPSGDDDPESPQLDRTSDVKTGPDGTPIRREASPEQWEAVGRDALATLLNDKKIDLVHEAEETVGAIEYGEPVTAEHVTRLRDAIALLERAVETRLVPLVDAAEPWESTPRRVPDERLREALNRDGDAAGSDSDESRPE